MGNLSVGVEGHHVSGWLCGGAALEEAKSEAVLRISADSIAAVCVLYQLCDFIRIGFDDGCLELSKLLAFLRRQIGIQCGMPHFLQESVSDSIVLFFLHHQA